MSSKTTYTLQDLVRHVGCYPEDAFLFVRDGLHYAAISVHGPESDAHRILQQYLVDHELDWGQFRRKYESGELPAELVAAVEAVGGPSKLNRHITGRDLCWGLRNLALAQWGALAQLVLGSWGIYSTADFGRIVFGFIDFQLMQKQDHDRLEDFQDVFDFADAFDRSYQIPWPPRAPAAEA